VLRDEYLNLGYGERWTGAVAGIVVSGWFHGKSKHRVLGWPISRRGKRKTNNALQRQRGKEVPAGILGGMKTCYWNVAEQHSGSCPGASWPQASSTQEKKYSAGLVQEAKA
jgi:hypothetical protein